MHVMAVTLAAIVLGGYLPPLHLGWPKLLWAAVKGLGLDRGSVVEIFLPAGRWSLNRHEIQASLNIQECGMVR